MLCSMWTDGQALRYTTNARIDSPSRRGPRIAFILSPLRRWISAAPERLCDAEGD